MSIAKQIYAEIGKQCHGMDTHSIGVDEFAPGVITLSGNTQQEYIPAKIEAIAKATPGVTEVKNDIKVSSGS